MGVFAAALKVKQLVSPPNPNSGENALYPKADNKWYTRNSSGTEALVGPGTTRYTGSVNVDAAGTWFTVPGIPADGGYGYMVVTTSQWSGIGVQGVEVDWRSNGDPLDDFQVRADVALGTVHVVVVA